LEYPNKNGSYDETVYNGVCPNTCKSDTSVQWTNKMYVSAFNNLSATTNG